MMRLFISIIIPTFNRSATLIAAIESVRQQSFANWKLLVVDDGSTDNTAQLIGPYLDDPRISYFQQVNAGVSSARNFGAAKVESEYIYFLDSDDLMTSGTLESFMRGIGDSGADVLFGSCCMIRDGVSTVKKPKDMGKLFKHVKGLFLAGSFCIRRSIFLKAGGFNERLKFGENYELGMRVCQLPVKTVVVDCITARYFIDSTKRTSNSIDNKLISNLHILETHKSLLTKDRRYFSVLLSQIGYLYRAKGNDLVAKEFYWKSFLQNPFNMRNFYRLATTFI